ncbi:BlaI/MecI/CopY family transcriptional regulator [Halorientalis brevis]|uniref:BlaI/MecI/CopY family transcriptional regulator n=1 Tax=Halorientalis brevis TaxID=1126241 RepID=A0ABD6C6J0_9EURY|nr:BlaI/MecI/CopY family transcriptional regulator [Halorientalis brevis]
MPVDLRTHDPDDGVDIDPGTNKAKIIKLLYSNPHLGYKPSEIHTNLDIPKGSVTTTLLRLCESDHIGKTTDGYYHALESRDDLRRFATGLVQVEDLTSRYAGDELSPGDAEQTRSREERLENITESERTANEIDTELAGLEDDLE